MSTKREVYLRKYAGAIFVMFKHRKKGGRYTAAQFAAATHSLEQVAEWVGKQRRLSLVAEFDSPKIANACPPAPTRTSGHQPKGEA